MQAQIKNRVLAWMFTLVPYPFLRGFVGMGGPVGEREMRFFNTPLPFSFSPTPPHTWDGHFISEYSKWKGDLNLPCLPVTPFLSPSPTHSFRCWWTERCWLPIADTKVLYSEKHSPPPQILSFVLLKFFWVIGSLWKYHLTMYFSLFSMLCSLVPLARYSVLGLSHCCQCFNHCSHKPSYTMTIDFLWIAWCKPVH